MGKTVLINLKKLSPIKESGLTMKNEKKFHARDLYLHTDLTKTQIAERLDVDRKTIYLWVREGAWDRVKRSAEHMPAFLAEQCYFLFGHLTKHLLADGRFPSPVTLRDAETLHKLTLTINKLKARSTVGENMEMFTYFLSFLKKRSPGVADIVIPYIEEFIDSRADVYMSDFKPDDYTWYCTIPAPGPQQREEERLDKQNADELENGQNGIHENK